MSPVGATVVLEEEAWILTDEQIAATDRNTKRWRREPRVSRVTRRGCVSTERSCKVLNETAFHVADTTK